MMRWGDSPPEAVPTGVRPPFSFSLRQKENAPRTAEEKKRLCALRHLRASALLRGAAYRCKRRFGVTFGHTWVFCEFAAAVLWRMIPTASGCKDAFELLLFPRVPLRYALPRRFREVGAVINRPLRRCPGNRGNLYHQ